MMHMHCDKCTYKHYRLLGETCTSCPYKEYNCDTCVYRGGMTYDSPCYLCENFSYYEPKVEIE